VKFPWFLPTNGGDGRAVGGGGGRPTSVQCLGQIARWKVEVAR
jgi:hypothetical protein